MPPPPEVRIPLNPISSTSRIRRRLKTDPEWKEREVLVIAGETSGDLLGGDLVRSLQRAGFRNFFGTGGESMAEAGVQLVRRVEEMEVIGFLEALKAYSKLKKLMLEIVAQAREKNIRHAILIDYPGFNLRIARHLHEAGIRVFYMVSPQLWAWKYNRIHAIRRYVDVMFTLFPFEEDMYRREGVPAVCIGHPMVDRIPRQLAEQKPIPSAGNRLTIGILPGSRGSEIKRLLPDMLAAARKLHEQYPKARFLLPNINAGLRGLIEEMMSEYQDLPIEYLEGRSLRVMEASHLVLIASGTATLETAWFRTPMVIVYRSSGISFFIAGIVSRVRFVGLANILAREQVAVELLQSEVSPENIFDAAHRILADPARHREITRELDRVRRSLGRGNPAGRAAKHIAEYIRRDAE